MGIKNLEQSVTVLVLLLKVLRFGWVNQFIAASYKLSEEENVDNILSSLLSGCG